LDGDREVDASGWRLRNAQPLTADDRRRGIEYAWKDFGAPLQTFEVCEAACRAQHDLLVRCREEQIAVALIWMPEATLFQSWYPAAVEEQVRRHLDALCQEFGLPLIDARNWLADDDFVDGQHLRHVGAQHFTERLADEILCPVLLVERSHWGQHLASLRQDSILKPAFIAGRPIIIDDGTTRLR
jgi:hypothetical protein